MTANVKPTRGELRTQWRKLIDAYSASLTESQSGSDAGHRISVARIERFATDIASDPTDVSPERFDRWVGTLTKDSAASYVKAVRRFYEWAVSTGVCPTNPTPLRIAERRYAPDQKWQDALDAFDRFERAAGIKLATVRRRLRHVRQFASSLRDLSPWLVTHDDYRAWIDTLDVAPSTLAAMRDSLRAFYRWASKEGKIREDPTLEPQARYRRLGVPEAWDLPLRQFRAYLVGRGLSPATVRLQLDLMSNFAREHASSEPFSIRMDDIFEFFAAKTWQRETLRTRRQSLKSFYRWATVTGRCAIDPTENLPIVRPGDVVAKPATDDQYVDAVRAALDPRWALALRLGFELGLRRAEVARIHSSDLIENQAGEIFLTVHGKGGKKRVLPIPDRLLPAIRERGEGYLLPSQSGGHVSPRYLGKRISELLPPGVTMHALRHAFATRIYNINSDVFGVQELLGHASAATTQRYVHVSSERLRNLVNTDPVRRPEHGVWL